jgi:hypothetical protein
LAMSDGSWSTRDLGANCHVLQRRGGSKSSAGWEAARAICTLCDVRLDDCDTEGAGSDLGCHRRPNLMHGKTV